MARAQELQIQLELLRIGAAAAVVLLHVAAGVVLHPDDTLAQWWAGNIAEVVSRWGVPMFVMISGALLLGDRRPFIRILLRFGHFPSPPNRFARRSDCIGKRTKPRRTRSGGPAHPAAAGTPVG